ncbi:MAG: prefoldin subunit alpha [Candidatus Methanomethylophilaceae archaeon]|nr:prefoldin subunit alpha [Candidatus Methanomethylophilaceae archaeon]
MNDDELRQALAALDAYKNQLNALTQQSQLLQMSYEETLSASQTLASLVDAKEGDEIMVPVGASSFITAKVTSSPKAVVGIGNKVSVEKDLSDAVEYMKSNLNEIADALKKLNESMQEMDAAARNLSVAVQQEYQRRQQ